ncbi:MAG: rhomboid family intramembrane serine protease [Candidatus Gracilibacteria bacterium]|nr:rhomboid family intramembrane serine protease [Candidatus Gracilibacteria bacterium]
MLTYIYPNIYVLGINTYFLNQGNYFVYFIQFFTGTFLHAGFLHLFLNSIFIYYFGNIIEALIGRKKFTLFFIFSTVFIGLIITNYSYNSIPVNTVGISGFAMALLTFYTLELKRRNNPEYKGGITALVINIGIGLLPQISLLGHLFGAIAGLIFYLINRDYLRKKLIGLIVGNTEKIPT